MKGERRAGGGGIAARRIELNRRSAAADILCGCAFCILTTAQTDGIDRCPRFLRRHEVRYMEAYFVVG